MRRDNNQNIATENRLLNSDLLKQKCEEGHNILTHYIKAFAIYVAIIGVILKFALDKDATSELRVALLAVGLLISIVGIFTCFLGEKLRKAISYEIDNLNSRLGYPLELTDLIHLKYTVIIALTFVSLIILGLLFLILNF